MQDTYSSCTPVNADYVGRCFYCGLEAEEQFKDFIPPKQYLPFIGSLNMEHAPCSMPCCKECNELLSRCSDATVEARKQFLNDRVAKKYKEALTIYERWDENELTENGASLDRSIRAGISLGKEADQRLKFRGFAYELNGKTYRQEIEPDVSFEVFGETFPSYRDALQYAARAYSVAIDELSRLVSKTKSFDEAITVYNAERVAKLEKAEREKICAQFARTHQLNKGFVLRTLTAYEKRFPELSPEECLSKFRDDRLS